MGSWQTAANDSAVTALVVLVLGRTVPGRQVPVFWGGEGDRGDPGRVKSGAGAGGGALTLRYGAVRCGALDVSNKRQIKKVDSGECYVSQRQTREPFVRCICYYCPTAAEATEEREKKKKENDETIWKRDESRKEAGL